MKCDGVNQEITNRFNKTARELAPCMFAIQQYMRARRLDTEQIAKDRLTKELKEALESKPVQNSNTDDDGKNIAANIFRQRN